MIRLNFQALISSDCFEVNPNFRRYLAMIFEKDNAVIVIESSINSLLVA